jgi:hypothetical protein
VLFFKRHIIILLLTGLVCSPLFFSAFYCFEQIRIEYEMEQALKTEPLQEIMISTNQIIWLKKDKEILVKNNPFDIKTKKQVGDSTIFTGLFDKQEKKLKNKLLAAKSEKENNGRKQSLLFRINFLSQVFLYQKLVIDYYPIQKKIYYSYHNSPNKEEFVSILTPPPRYFYPIHYKSKFPFKSV